MKCAVFDFPDGRVGVLHAAPRKMAELIAGGLTEEDAMLALAKRDLEPSAANVVIIDEADLPDRSEREKWRRSADGRIEVAG